MMMPANYSAIAENELTYVVGGAGIGDVLPTVMGPSQWKTLTTNIVTIIGNNFVGKLVNATLGVMFSGNWDKDGLTLGKSLFGEEGESGLFKKVGDDGNVNILNTVMAGIGGLAAVYTLGFNSVKAVANGSKFTSTLAGSGVTGFYNN
ncbi:MAG: hypothetical protein ACI4JC_03500 [Faecalibacterium sp.]